MEAVQFDQLPYLKIFGFLKLRDLAKCRAVNRQFKDYAEIAVDELAVSDERTQCSELCEHWYPTYQSNTEIQSAGEHSHLRTHRRSS